MSKKNSNNNIGNRTRDLPACSAVPQQTVPMHAENRVLRIIFLRRREEITDITRT